MGTYVTQLPSEKTQSFLKVLWEDDILSGFSKSDCLEW